MMTIGRPESSQRRSAKRKRIRERQRLRRGRRLRGLLERRWFVEGEPVRRVPRARVREVAHDVVVLLVGEEADLARYLRRKGGVAVGERVEPHAGLLQVRAALLLPIKDDKAGLDPPAPLA